jgi:hypothetical protein
VGSHPGEGAGAAPDGSSSMSVRELWPGIDQLDDIGPKKALVASASDREGDRSPRSDVGSREVARVGNNSCGGRGASGLPSASLRRCDGGSAKNKVAQILMNAGGAISP